MELHDFVRPTLVVTVTVAVFAAPYVVGILVGFTRLGFRLGQRRFTSAAALAESAASTMRRRILQRAHAIRLMFKRIFGIVRPHVLTVLIISVVGVPLATMVIEDQLKEPEWKVQEQRLISRLRAEQTLSSSNVSAMIALGELRYKHDPVFRKRENDRQRKTESEEADVVARQSRWIAMGTAGSLTR